MKTPAGQRPLCPAGHLPHLGGDRLFWRLAFSSPSKIGESSRDVQSPPRGEMPGRAEGGAKE
ncbi:lytic murein transglycosylase [Mesorhizobium sp. M1A.F.Ca.IN.022.07.1.1]|nr:lytic murein transglycosylase [Mesorhizobium sp. M1A.F.Ca.IN.022.07.1.1]RWG94285.1 MAG: lytic murein transglycosylase [Mesorhizobium sp.]TIR90868.1 MAG: lytic murein transglycosylase [Mesorhizobium sp.]